jgi:hypothetical protein
MHITIAPPIDEPTASKIHRSYGELLKYGPGGAWFKKHGVVHRISGAYLYHKGLYPQIDSDEWIEYIPPCA